MTNLQPDAVFGARRRPPHTVIIARGDRIRHFTVRPWMAATALGSLLALTIAGSVGTANLLSNGDLLTAAISRDDDLRQSYEQRISSLRAELDRVTSKQLVGQQQMEKQVSELLRRQAELSERHDMVEPIALRARGDAGETASSSPDADKRVDAGDFRLRGADGASSLTAYASSQAGKNIPWPLRGEDVGASPTTPTADTLASIGRSLAGIASAQVDKVGQMTETAYEAADAISAALQSVGMAKSTGEADVGGPYIPANGEVAFQTRVQELDNALGQLETLKKQAKELPLRDPAPGRVVTSSFGVRPDPLLGKPAFHAGLDFRSAYGSPVRATAPGTVLRAGWAGGYGRMIEIDAGSGITVRFGHLSRILVAPGDKVKTGDLIGKSGNSGRSTGPHLHYEIRKDGEPVNPVTFLKAGRKISRFL